MIDERPVIVTKLPKHLSAREVGPFFRQMAPSLEGTRPRVVFDFSQVCELDRSGVGLLLHCLETVMKENGDLKLAAIPPSPAILSQLSYTDGLFERFETPREAVESFGVFSARDLQFSLEPLSPDTVIDRVQSEIAAQTRAASNQPSRAVMGLTLRLVTMLTRLVSAFVVLAMVTFWGAGTITGQEANPAPQQVVPARDSTAQESTPPQAGSEQVPDSPGTVRAQMSDTAPAQPDPPRPTGATRSPVGTAAAELTTTSGVAASKPAGAAFAPAKQRRFRTIAISVGAVLGACVAAGSVAALSKGSPSKPPGSH